MKLAEFLAILLITAACLVAQLVSALLGIAAFSVQDALGSTNARLLAYSVLCGTVVGLCASAMFPIKTRDRSQLRTMFLSVLSACVGFILFGMVVVYSNSAGLLEIQLWRYAGSAVVSIAAVGLPGVFRGYRLGHSAKLAGVAALLWILGQAIGTAAFMLIMRDFNPR